MFDGTQQYVSKDKIFIAGLILCLVFFMIITFRNVNKTNDMVNKFEGQIEYLKNEKDSIINLKTNENKKLLQEIAYLDKYKINTLKTIDSLKREASKIKIIYRDKVDKIKDFNSTQTVEYWVNEFK